MKFKIDWKLFVYMFVTGSAISTWGAMHFVGDSFMSAFLNSLIAATISIVPLFSIVTGYSFIKHQNKINAYLLSKPKHVEKKEEIIIN